MDTHSVVSSLPFLSWNLTKESEVKYMPDIQTSPGGYQGTGSCYERPIQESWCICYFPKLKVVDPICTFLFSILVLITTINVLRDALSVLMEATPRGLDFNDVKNALNDVPGVVELHNLRMWSLTMNKTAVSVHLAVAELGFT
ncbi:hypothetical protein X801_01593 [Opisthorchis viverrini]|uniref:Cation efflux protein cytoplasmic domain-containing protein n=1 Tax=Opisthorchis viverrini TaxID=6198 RepID=A0A1S8X6Y9_OPIVI|nr:hypothetical protein X801_01593 [Opisthorchis viverrini]